MRLDYAYYADVYGVTNNWTLNPPSSIDTPPNKLKLFISIISTSSNGYNLIVEPEGYDPITRHFNNLSDAKEYTFEQYRVGPQDWVLTM